MWAKVEKETKRGKRKWKMAELFADERCSEAILGFLRTTDVGRKVPVEKAEQELPRASASAGCADGRAGFTRFTSRRLIFLICTLFGRHRTGW